MAGSLAVRPYPDVSHISFENGLPANLKPLGGDVSDADCHAGVFQKKELTEMMIGQAAGACLFLRALLKLESGVKDVGDCVDISKAPVSRLQVMYGYIHALFRLAWRRKQRVADPRRDGGHRNEADDLTGGLLPVIGPEGAPSPLFRSPA